MKVYTSIPEDLPPCALAIGTFDGVHLGHRALLKKLTEASSETVILTFSNHPLEILNPAYAPKLLTPLSEKIDLLEHLGVRSAIAIPFTASLAALTYEDFLRPFPLTHLFLGAGDSFGKNREGNPANLLALSRKRNFKLLYIDKSILAGEPISSSRIRSALAAQNYELASLLLGRPIKKELYV
jgi:riboflavin kinase/FMN adenylyltransferase